MNAILALLLLKWAVTNALLPPLAASKPSWRFGIVGDIQYADSDDGSNFQGTAHRRYRQSLSSFAEAVGAWSILDDVKFGLSLGNSWTKKLPRQAWDWTHVEQSSFR